MEVNSVKIARDIALTNSKNLVVRDQANNYYISNGEKDFIIWIDDEATMIHISENNDYYSQTKYKYNIATVSYVDILQIEGICDKANIISIINKYKSKLSDEEYKRAKDIYNF